MEIANFVTRRIVPAMKKARQPRARRAWIREHLDATGKTQADLGLALKLPPPRITGIISGARRVGVDEVFPLATFLEMTPLEVMLRLSEETAEGKRWGIVKVIGAAEGGAVVPTMERQENEWYASQVDYVKAFAQYPQFGLEVRGTAANLLFPHGSVVNCVRFVDLKRPARHGENVIVARMLGGGVEVTIRELKEHPDGSRWLWFKSSDPLYQEPVAEAAEGVEVVALIIGSFRREDVTP